MKEIHQDIPCACPENESGKCLNERAHCPENTMPLSKVLNYDRFKVCRINGDRKLCARMAQLGVLPGSEIEVICPAQSQRCMVKVKGSTVSLDKLSADNILVTPA